jgi:hypothetical protein
MAGEDSELEKTCSELAGIHFPIGKIKFKKKSGVQKVQNRSNRGIPQNSKRISQPRLEGWKRRGGVQLCQ